MPYLGKEPNASPSQTLGTGAAEDILLKLDGNAVDYYIGLDDSTDLLTIGKGSAVGTTSSMTFDANGITSLPLQPGCSVKHSGNQTIATGTWTKMTWQTERFDTNADYDNSTNYRFTCPVDGIYCVALSVSFHLAANTLASTAVHLNGSELHRSNGRSPNSTNSTYNVNTVVFIKCDATDYLEGFAAHEQGSDDAVTADYSYMSIMKVA
tara:strand:- start:93 stop:719 length:627 start_codon:yes stop_codon:yes gene_type:complete